MRGGPRGSSDQAALLQPTVVFFPTVTSLPAEVTENSGSALDLTWAPYFPAEAGYKVKRVFAIVSELYAGIGKVTDVGTSQDGDCFVDGFQIPDTTAAMSVVESTMNGVGAGLDPLADGNGDFLVGGSTGYTLKASNSGAASGQNGKYVLFAELIPVSGTNFSN